MKTKGTFYADNSMLEIESPDDLNFKDLYLKFSLNARYNNPYVTLMVKYNNGGTIERCTPTFCFKTTMRMSKMPQPTDSFGKKNAFLMAVPPEWVAFYEKLNKFVLDGITSTEPIQRWNAGTKRMVTEQSALVFTIVGNNPDRPFSHFPQAKQWFKEFTTQTKKPKMDKWSGEDWTNFSEYVRTMLTEADEGSQPVMKPLLVTHKESGTRSLRTNCRNMELGKCLLDEDGRRKSQTIFTDMEKRGEGEMDPEVAIRDLTYDENGADGLPTRGGLVHVVQSTSLWWYWFNDKGVNPTMNLNTCLYQKTKTMKMQAGGSNFAKHAAAFDNPPDPVPMFGDDEAGATDDAQGGPSEQVPPKKRRGGTRSTGTKKKNRRSVQASSDDEDADGGFTGALASSDDDIE